MLEASQRVNCNFFFFTYVFYCSQVHDYVKTYVGEGKPQKKFAMEYLERRSRWKNALKSGGKYEDDLTTPALALSPGDGDFQVRTVLPPEKNASFREILFSVCYS
jgi:hypothetical protein